MPLFQKISVEKALPPIPANRFERIIYDTSEGPLLFEGTENFPTGDWYDNTYDKYHHPKWWLIDHDTEELLTEFDIWRNINEKENQWLSTAEIAHKFILFKINQI